MIELKCYRNTALIHKYTVRSVMSIFWYLLLYLLYYSKKQLIAISTICIYPFYIQ